MNAQVRSALGLVCCLLAAGTAATAAAETHSIGTLGATIPAGSWERRTLSADLGPDQFFRADRNYCMVFFENFGLFEQRADFIDGLEEYLDGVRAAGPEATIDPEIRYRRQTGFARATRRVSGTFSGIELAYQLDLISAGDGVGYLVMSWSQTSDFEGLQEELEATLSGLTLPGPDSEWGAETVPSAHSFAYDDWTVELTFRDSVFTESDSVAGERYTLTADAGDVGVHLFLDEMEGDADEVLDQVAQVAASGEDYRELTRSDVETDIGPARQMLMRLAGEPPTDLALAVVGVGEDRWVDLRMVSSDRTGHRGYLWDELLGSLRVRAPVQVDAFPVVEAPAAEQPDLGPAARRLLEASRLLGAATSEVVAQRADGGIVLRQGNRLNLLPAGGDDGSSELLYQREDYVAGKIVPWGDRLLLVEGGGEVSIVAGGGLEPAGFEADVVAAAGEELVVARNGERRQLLGLVDLPRVGPARIALRGAGGEERPLAELAETDVAALGRRPTGEVLIAAAPRTVLPSAGEGPATRLLLVAAAGGAPAEIARWHRVERLEPAAGGWLVTGAPEKGAGGVHLVDDAGRAELLLSGDAVGLALGDGEVTFASGKCLAPSEHYYQRCVYSTGLDVARRLGGALQPFTARALNEIGARLRPDLETGIARGFPPTREAIAGFVAAADEAARELSGAELPVERGGLDDLMETLSYDRDLDDAGVLLLSVLLSESLLRDGAAWEPAAAPGAPARADADWEIETAFAVGLHPVTVVLSTLYEESGWYRPAAEIAERARGRTVVLGIDPEAVRRRVRAEEDAELAALLRAARVPGLVAALEERPDNLYLREAVYRHLAAHGRHAELAEVAEAFAARDDVQGTDLLARMAARLAGDLADDDLAAAVADLRAAIERAPAEAGLYLLLGSVYERTTEPERLALARACYRKARDSGGWGPVRIEAEQALERIGAEQ